MFFYARVIFWGIYIICCFVFMHKHLKLPASAFRDFNKEYIGKKTNLCKIKCYVNTFNKKKSIKVIAYRYSTIIYWTKLPWVFHFFLKSDFHLSNGVFPIFCYEISATALAGKFCVARGTRDTKSEVIECQFPLCISLLCAETQSISLFPER
jgi:hypothetical protein